MQVFLCMCLPYVYTADLLWNRIGGAHIYTVYISMCFKDHVVLKNIYLKIYNLQLVHCLAQSSMFNDDINRITVFFYYNPLVLQSSDFLWIMKFTKVGIKVCSEGKLNVIDVLIVHCECISPYG